MSGRGSETISATFWVSQVALVVKNPLTNAGDVEETWVQSLGWEDLEGAMATHSCILAWRTPWTEEPDGPQSIMSRLKQLGMHAHALVFYCPFSQ